MKNLIYLLIFVCVVLVYGVSGAAVSGKAMGTPLKSPEKALDAKTCLSCHDTVKKLYDRGAHSKVN